MNPTDLVVVEMALGQAPTVSSPTWTNVTSRIEAVSWACGRTDPTQQMSARTGTFTLHNRDGLFNIFDEPDLRHEPEAVGTDQRACRQVADDRRHL